MLAYHNDEKLKAATIAAMQKDIDAERLVKGSYWDAKKRNGCFVGCVIRGKDHGKFETQIGVPRILARLADRIFEALPYEDAKKFTIDFLTAIPPGADLSGVWSRFALFMLVDAAHGVIKFAKSDRTKEAIQKVADLYKRQIAGESIDINFWLEARQFAAAAAAAAYAAAAAADADADAAAAYAAAAAAAAAAADAYAAAAAAAAADAYAAAAAAAAAAAYAAADAYAAYAARSRHYVALAAKLIELLRG